MTINNEWNIGLVDGGDLVTELQGTFEGVYAHAVAIWDVATQAGHCDGLEIRDGDTVVFTISYVTHER